MLVALAAMLGQVGLPGGGFGFAYANAAAIGSERPAFPAPSLPMGQNAAGSAIPVARIADMLLDPGGEYDFLGQRRRYPDIRLVYWAGGNPFHHHQDLNRLLQAWRRPETIVVHEPWWTATARHADIVLPATTTLERNDIGMGARDRFLVAMQQAVPPFANARNDHDILAGLARNLGVADAFTEGRDEMGWLRHMYAQTRARAAERDVTLPDFDAFWEAGHVEAPTVAPDVLLADFRRDPSAAPLATPSGRIELFSETVHGFGYADCGGHPAWVEPAEWLGGTQASSFPLHLVSNMPAARLHAQLDMAGPSQDSKVHDREPCRMNPRDAAARDLHDGDVVRLFNDRGACLAGLRVSDDVRPGVVQMYNGAWYDPVDKGTVGALDVHGNVNVLTADRGTSRLGQGPSAHSALVECERFDGPLPPVTAFVPPAVEARS
jgi:biotin/methionine sulfoxide reductase